MSTHAQLRELLCSRVRFCFGDWVAFKSGYEQELCAALTLTVKKDRYGDAEWQGLSIELKKGKSIWLDLVRYAELADGHRNLGLSVTLFCVPDQPRQRIAEIIAVPTQALLTNLNLRPEHIRLLLELKAHVPRGLNAQPSVTVGDVREMAHFVVRS